MEYGIYGVYILWDAVHLIKKSEVDIDIVAGNDDEDIFFSGEKGTEWYVLGSHLYNRKKGGVMMG